MQIYSWDKAGFESAYWKQYYKQRGCGASRAHNCQCSEVDITYSRQFFEGDNLFKVRAQNIISKLALEQGTDIFVIGCGLGLLMEELNSLGMNVWGCDDSQYIHTIKNKEKVRIPIQNVSILDTAFTHKVRNSIGAMWFDVIITEDLLTSHDSYTQIFKNCESVLNPSKEKTNIVHLVDTNVKSPFTSKTLIEWKELNNNYTWLNALGLEQ